MLPLLLRGEIMAINKIFKRFTGSIWEEYKFRRHMIVIN